MLFGGNFVDFLHTFAGKVRVANFKSVLPIFQKSVRIDIKTPGF